MLVKKSLSVFIRTLFSKSNDLKTELHVICTLALKMFSKSDLKIAKNLTMIQKAGQVNNKPDNLTIPETDPDICKQSVVEAIVLHAFSDCSSVRRVLDKRFIDYASCHSPQEIQDFNCDDWAVYCQSIVCLDFKILVLSVQGVSADY